MSTTPQPQPRSKLVIRRLPPTLPEDIFWNSVSPWVTDETCLWKHYVKGHPGDDHGGHPTFSRAYCLMSSPEALVAFHTSFDGHVYRSKAGLEYQAVVEFSPMQKTPYKVKVKPDARQATIDDDPDYLSFIDSLNAPPTKPSLETTVPPPQPTSTPLLDHLRANGPKRKSKNKGSSSDNTRTAALASVTAASAKRAPNSNGVTMIAGKGREVLIAPNTPLTATSSGEIGEGKVKKRGGRGKGKGPAQAGESSQNGVTDGQNASFQGEGRGRGRGHTRGGEGGRGTPHRAGGSGPEGTTSSNQARDDGAGKAEGGRGGRGGRGRDRSARGTVLEILGRNSAPKPKKEDSSPAGRIDM